MLCSKCERAQPKESRQTIKDDEDQSRHVVSTNLLVGSFCNSNVLFEVLSINHRINGTMK